jgi:hypothetical protein
MNLRHVTVATTAAVLILASPAAASTPAAAGPSATPLILELILAAVVVTGMALRRPASRALAAVRRTIAAPRARTTARARARV